MFIKTLEQYARSLGSAGAVLMLAGGSSKDCYQLVATGAITRIGAEHVFIATDRFGDPLQEAMDAVEVWRARRMNQEPPQQQLMIFDRNG